MLDPRQDPKHNRAKELLLSHLDKTQQKQFKRTGTFEVKGKSGTKYRINRDTGANVEYVSGPRPPRAKTRFWVEFDHRYSQCPIEDVLLAQKLRLETDDHDYAYQSC